MVPLEHVRVNAGGALALVPAKAVLVVAYTLSDELHGSDSAITSARVHCVDDEGTSHGVGGAGGRLGG